MKRTTFFALLAIFSLNFSSVALASAEKNNEFSLKKFGMTFEQIKKSAAQGDPDAEYALGYLYYYGQGIARDEQTARVWIAKAASQGQQQAIKAQELLGQPVENKTADASVGMEGEAKVQARNDQPTNAPITQQAKNETSATASTPAQEKADNAKVASAERDQAAATDDSATINPTNPSKLTAADQRDKMKNIQQMKAVDKNAVAANQLQSQPDQSQPQAEDQSQSTIKITNADQKKVASAKQHKAVNHRHKNETVSASVAVSETKLRNAPANYHTIQLFGAYHQSEAVNFIASRGLKNKATFYQTAFNGKPWFVVVYGIYPTEHAASDALKSMPANLQKLNPWIKSLGNVQHGMQLAAK